MFMLIFQLFFSSCLHVPLSIVSSNIMDFIIVFINCKFIPKILNLY